MKKTVKSFVQIRGSGYIQYVGLLCSDDYIVLDYVKNNIRKDGSRLLLIKRRLDE